MSERARLNKRDWIVMSIDVVLDKISSVYKLDEETRKRLKEKTLEIIESNRIKRYSTYYICGEYDIGYGIIYYLLTQEDRRHPLTPAIMKKLFYIDDFCVAETARALAKDLKTGLIHTPDPVEIIRIVERNEEIAKIARGLLQKNLPKMSPMVTAAGLSYIAHLMRGEEISKSVIARLYGVTEVSIRTFYSRYMILNRGER